MWPTFKELGIAQPCKKTGPALGGPRWSYLLLLRGRPRCRIPLGHRCLRVSLCVVLRYEAARNSASMSLDCSLRHSILHCWVVGYALLRSCYLTSPSACRGSPDTPIRFLLPLRWSHEDLAHRHRAEVPADQFELTATDARVGADGNRLIGGSH